MKTTLYLLITLFITLSLPAQAEDPNPSWYFLFGSSYYAENDDRGVGDGLGMRFGGGVQFNDTIALEVTIDSVPEYEASYQFDDDVSRLLGEYVIKSENHIFASLMCAISIPIDDRVKFTGKIGLSAYRYDLIMESQIYGLERPPINPVDYYDESFVLGYNQDENGVTLAGSAGVEIPFGESDNLSVQVSLTRLFGDDSAGASLNVGLKSTF